MIEIKVEITASVIVSPEAWDSTGGLEASIGNAIDSKLAYYGHDIETNVKARAL